MSASEHMYPEHGIDRFPDTQPDLKATEQINCNYHGSLPTRPPTANRRDGL